MEKNRFVVFKFAELNAVTAKPNGCSKKKLMNRRVVLKNSNILTHSF